MAYLEIKDLYKSFGNTEVLKGINLDIEKGEVAFDELHKLCYNLNNVYVNMISCCWKAYQYNADKDGDPSKFIIRQIKIVAETVVKLESCGK